MGAVADAVSDVVEGAVDIVEDTVETVGDVAGDTLDAVGDAVESVGETLETTVQAALDDPIGTIATIATAVYAPYMLPAVSAGRTLANGGDLGDALTAAAVSYVAQGVGDYVGDQIGTSINYGTDIGSQQTAMLAAQTGDMMGGTLGGTIGNAAAAAASGATTAALTGGDIGQAAINALGTYGLRAGVDYSINAAGQAIDSSGKVIADSDGTIMESPYDGVAPEFGTEDNQFLPQTDATGDSTFQDGTIGISESSPDGVAPEFGTEGNEFKPESDITGDTTFQPTVGISEGSEDGVAQEFGTEGNEFKPESDVTGDGTFQPEVPAVDPYEVDNVGNRDEADYLVGEDPNLDPLFKKAGQYFKNQFTNRLARDIFSDTPGAAARPSPAPTNTGTSGISGRVSSSSIYNLLAGQQFEPSFSDDASLSSAEPSVDLGSNELFNPLGNATWAPQSKIGGLGFAGKYINRDADTYYVSKEQEDRQKALEKLQTQPGWMTEEERQQLLNEAGVQNPSEASPFFDAGSFDPYDLTYAAGGGLMGHNPEFYSEGGASIGNRYVKGRGDGTSDSVPAMLASGEFVIPADVVSGLGNGDNDAGAKVLDRFMEEIRKHKRGGSPKQLPPNSLGPLSYLSSAMTKAKRK